MAFTALGAKLSLSASHPATYDAAGFAALTYTQAAGLLSAGITLGGTWGTTSDTVMETGEQVTSKTSKSAQEFTVSHFAGETNAGITLLQAAYDSREYYSFKLENGAGDVLYFEAHVTGMVENSGDTEAHERVEYTIMPRAVGAVKV